MKQRLLVMNGQCIVQNEQGGGWINHKVSKAGELKPGIYNLYLAESADKTRQYEGVIVYTDSNNAYQQVGKNFVMHSRADFDKVPALGSAKCISYDAQGKANVSAETVKLSRGHAR